MNYRNARLANGFLSLDKLAGEIDLVKSRVVSDGGAGVERMVGDVDRKPDDAEREERETAAGRRFPVKGSSLRNLSAITPLYISMCSKVSQKEPQKFVSMPKIRGARNFFE